MSAPPLSTTSATPRLQSRVGPQGYKGFVSGGGSRRLGNAADDRVAVIAGGERILEARPGIDIIGGPEATDRLGGVDGRIDLGLAGDREGRAVDVLGPIGRRVAAPDAELDAEVRAVCGIVGIDLGDRAVDGRGRERATLRGLQLRPGDVQHELAEAAPVRRDLGDVEAGIVGIVVEADVAHIDKPGLGRLVAVTG
jgi:hypothetical protein